MKSNYLLTELTSELLSSLMDWRCSNLVYSAKEHSLYSFDVMIACQQGVAGKWSWFDPSERDLKILTSRQIAYMMKQQVIVKQLVNDHNSQLAKRKREETKDMFGGRTLDQVVADKLQENKLKDLAARHAEQYKFAAARVGVATNVPEEPVVTTQPEALDKDRTLFQSFKQIVAAIVREVMEENCYEN